MTHYHQPNGTPPPQPGPYGHAGPYPAYDSAPAPYGQQPGYSQPHPQGGQPYQQGRFRHPSVDPRQPYGTPRPGPPPKRGWFSRHPFLSAVLTVAAVLLVAIVASPGQDDSATTSAGNPNQPVVTGPTSTDPDDPAAGAAPDQPSEEPSDEPTEEATEEPDLAFGIGDAASAGDFEFVVEGIETGRESIGNGFLNEEAQGQYLLVEISVTNTGNEEATFYGGDQVVVDTEGREHSADSGAWMYLDDEEGFFITDINPGNSTAGTLVFDIPTDATPASILLSDGLWFSSNEVEVSLR